MTETTTTFRAFVRVLYGNRKMSEFMAAAGLGITGVGVWETLTIDYKPGEVVDTDRVAKVMDNMMAQADRENSPIKIIKYEVLGVYRI